MSDDRILSAVPVEDDETLEVSLRPRPLRESIGRHKVLASDVKSKVESLPAIKQAEVEVIFDPVGDRSMMSEAARLQLGMY